MREADAAMQGRIQAARALEDARNAIRSDQTRLLEGFETIKSNVAAIPRIVIDRRIVNWLKSTDPSTNHESARQKHEPTTGNWLIQSDTFHKWENSTSMSLWINGIPGAGKTVLCSTIIEHVKGLCLHSTDAQIAYFYFDFNDPQKQTIAGMLRSMIVQLCVGKAQLPTQVHEIYNQCNNGNQQPTLQGLINTLFSLLANSQRTYVIIDALDECSERKQLMTVINQIIKNSSLRVNLLATSRKEQDILEGLQGVIDIQINLEGDGIDADIDLHIRKCLESDQRLKKWNSLIKQEILEVLVAGAHGM